MNDDFEIPEDPTQEEVLDEGAAKGENAIGQL